MTSDPAQPVTKPETFRSHLPAIAAAAAGTVLAAVLGSLMGAAGTVAGMAIGSLVSGTCSWWAEQGIRRSAAIAAARAAAIRARGRPLRAGEDAAATRAAAARHDRGRRHRRWAGPAALAAAAFIGCAVSVTLVEQGAGRPLSALVQGKPGHGTTLGGAGGGTAPARTAPSPPASTTGPATHPGWQHHARQQHYACQQFPGGRPDACRHNPRRCRARRQHAALRRSDGSIARG
jgi:hypothetical protein